MKERWRSEGWDVRPGVPLQEIEAFESRYRVTLPADLREFFLTVDGMGQDLNLNQFVRLDGLKPVSELFGDFGGPPPDVDDEPGSQKAGRHFVLVDVLCSSYFYTIRLSADPSRGTPVYALNDSGYRMVAGSFSEFGERYLNGWEYDG
jgi:hypothetical protein